jgi:outer membrane murein-binding lipoprotein Lpp
MTARLLIAGLAGATLLAGCASDNKPRPESTQPAPAVSAQPAPPDVGFSPDVSAAALDACRAEVDAQTDGAVEGHRLGVLAGRLGRLPRRRPAARAVALPRLQ